MLGIGQISLDRVRVAGEGASSVPARTSAGGQVATAVLALARLGARCAYAGAVGGDPEAELALAPLRRAGVDCSAVKRVLGGRTRRADIRVDPGSGERRVRPDRDPAVKLEPADLDRRQIESARALLVDAEDPDVLRWAVRIARDAKVAVVLDADQPGPELDALLPLVDFPIVSHEFAESFSDGSVRKALRDLAAQASHLAVVTLGARGAIAQARNGDTVLESPAFEIEAFDTTGAGDVFHAAFIWGLLEGLDLRAVLRTANAAAALSCRGPGAQGGLPDHEELAAFLTGQTRG